MTAFSQIHAFLVGRLKDSPAVAGGRVYSNRDLRRIPEGYPDYVVVRQERTRRDRGVLGVLDWQTLYLVECYGRTVAVQSADDAVDGLIQAVVSRLELPADAGLGIAAVDVADEVEWVRDDAETTMTCAAIQVLVRHRTDSSLQPVA